MIKENNYVVIMAGGIGSRFWPFSRTNQPKQYHDVLNSGKTLIQTTVERFKNICPDKNIFIVTNERYKDITKEQLPSLADNQILLEPARRNTGPCIAYAAYLIRHINPDANIVVAPSDHLIEKEDAFEIKILEALEAASKKTSLITLGIQPDKPATGYGYIQYLESSKSSFQKVKTFTEKPTEEIALKFIDSGDFVWNAGIFIWNVNTLIEGLEEHAPDITSCFEDFQNNENFIKKAYTTCPNISIDYCLMEKANNVYVILSDIGWSDLGTWESLYSISDKDENGNVTNANTLSYDSKNCIIKTSNQRLVVIQGLEDYIVAENDGVLMICKKNNEELIKDFVLDVKKFKENFS